MLKLQNIFRWTLVATLALIAGCMNNGTEIPNGAASVISGRLLDANSKPVAGAQVLVVPANYVPSLTSQTSGVIATTDANGNYQVAVDTGIYNIDCEKDSLGAFIDSIRVSHDTGSVHVADHTMKRLGSITGISYMAGQSDTNQVRVTLYIPGTGRITKPVIGGAFSFSDVPEGTYQIIIDPTLNDFDVKVINATVTAGNTLNLDTVSLPAYQPNTIVLDAFSDILHFFKTNALFIDGETITGPHNEFSNVTVLKAQYDLTAQLPTFVTDSLTGESPSLLTFYPATLEPKTYSCSIDNLGKKFESSNTPDTSDVYQGNFIGSSHATYFYLKSVTRTVTSVDCNYYAGKGFTFGWGFFYPVYGTITIRYQ